MTGIQLTCTGHLSCRLSLLVPHSAEPERLQRVQRLQKLKASWIFVCSLSMALFRDPKTSSSRSATSPLNSGFSYDVFLSFRGEDTRKTFTDHLYTALDNAGFRTFRDDPELERGENIKQKLEEAIQQSRSSVIVFSKDYTSSKWCLDELVMILERTRTSNHFILPVFYNIKPSKLRKQADNLSKVYKYQENQSLEKLNGWRATLREVADLAGMELQNVADGHESKFIQNLVKVIQDKLDRCVPLSVVQEKLQEKLLDVNRVLDDAERKQLNNPEVKAWLGEHKETEYVAEDLLQEIQTEVSRQKKAPESESSTSKVKELISSSPSHDFDSASMNSRVKEVLERLDCIEKKGKDVLGLQAIAGHRVSQTMPSTCLVEDSVYGRDEDKETFIKLLLSDDAQISVIPIVGMAGIGKTTLAQLLYNDVRVEQHFDLRAWAWVSEEFDVHRISQHICESLKRNTCQNESLNRLHLNLEEAVKGQKFFFVLDDIWIKDYILWDSLVSRPFKFGAHGSKIIVTARNLDVASMVGTVETHPLMPISEQDGWFLFEKHAFKNTGVGAYSNLEAIGRQIVRNCKGHPLALKSLGGVLRSDLSVREWERVLNSDIWDVESSGIMPALWVSYCYLPLYLKHCFAYCSIFPKGYEIEKSELLSLWNAEGLLQRTKTNVVQEVGEYYFNALVSKSFFQPYLPQTSCNKPYYIMHDLIHDLAKFVSGDFCVSWEDSESSKVVTHKTRHFAYMKRYSESNEKFGALHEAIHLRTFLPLTRKMVIRLPRKYEMGIALHDRLLELRSLRVLNLSEYDIQELPNSINNLKLLRHLNMSLTPIRKLPDTICSLYNLQELLLSDCENLTALPSKLGRLTNLSHLDIEGTSLKEMPAHMGNLKDLQILNKFVLGKHNAGDIILELKKLQNLRGRLCISGLGNIVNGSALEANLLKDTEFLAELVLDWGSDRGPPRTDVDTQIESEVLDKLQPHAKLEYLSIRQYRGTNFPDWSRYFASSTLVYLQLKQCENCTSLPPLGRLESLRVLHMERLQGVEAIGPEFYGCGTSRIEPFRSLQVLYVSKMSKLKEWSYVGDANDERGVFPNLLELRLLDCYQLSGTLTFDKFPLLEILYLERTKLSFAISRCPQLLVLTSLTLIFCPEIVSFPDQGLDAPYLTDIVIRKCQNIRSLPEKMHTLLPSLRLLEISLCLQLKAPEGGLPSKLKSLEISCCEDLIENRRQWDIRRLTSLEKLSLNFRECQQVVDSFPEEGDNLPRTLTHLSINGHLNLKTINQNGFGHLDSLQSLEITNCPSLECLPGERLPTSLSSLYIRNCPLLRERCKRNKGEDWPKISHIAIIKVEGERI